MAKYSMKRNGKEVGPAEVYAEPHTMSGKKVGGTLSQTSGADCMKEMNISVGNISKNLGKPTKTDGIKIRGTGAATKGVMARGPMA
jgi:hypothetical protein